MSRIESIDANNWRDFVDSPLAVLMIGKSDCDNCSAWSAELSEFLSRDESWNEVRFGKLLLDQPGLIDFKRENPWLAEVDVLPFNVIYVRQERVKSFAGAGTERLTRRLERIRDR